MGSDELNELRARVTRLEDIEKAHNFLHAYAETIDAADPSAASDLFAPDGVLTTPAGPVRGRAAIRSFYAGIIERDRATKRHFLVGPTSEHLDRGRVRVRSSFLWTGRGEQTSMLGWGAYDDVIDVSSEQPVFISKIITPHVATDLAAGWPQ